MGWSGGSEVMGDIMFAFDKAQLTDKKRYKLYKLLIPALQRHDWDTESECLGEDPMYDKALKAIDPEWFEEE